MTKYHRILIHIFLLVSAGFLSTAPARSENEGNYRVVIYGGTSAGVIAAVQVAKMGNSVILIEPGQHLGGMSSGGLGRTDHGNKSAIGGLSLEFYQRVYDLYYPGNSDDTAQWFFAPHYAEQVYNDYISDYGIPVVFGERLDLDNGVRLNSGRIETIVMESGMEISGQMFIDATYEGDLMALAGVPYFAVRESNDTYGETYNGFQDGTSPQHNFQYPVDPYLIPGDPDSGLLPGITNRPTPAPGDGDAGIQAYNFRMCMTNNPDNRVEWTEPENYNPLNYEILLRYFDAGYTDVPLHFGTFAEMKADVNNNNAFSTDNIGRNWDYPDADYATRERIIEEHENYQRGLMWTLFSNPRVPENVRQKLSKWGLASDEFTGNNNWPFQIYVRVARRMLSDYIMTEHDITGDHTLTDSAGLGSYAMDTHNASRFVDENGHVRNEGNIYMGGFPPYPIAYRSIIPPMGNVENLLVPVCVSASHIAYGSIRMEPVYMILGQSAGAAAVISIDTDVSVQDLFYPILKTYLISQDQLLGTSISMFDLEGHVVDNISAVRHGEWIESTTVLPWIGDGYIHDDNTREGKSLEYIKRLSSGTYEIRFFYTSHNNRAENVPIRIHHVDGVSEVLVNEKLRPPIQGMSVSLGTYTFSESEPAIVEILNEGVNGYVVADAVQFIRVN